MLEIKRNGLIITQNGQLDASAGSYDVPVTLINDDTYSDYVINMFVGWYARGILKKRKAEIDSDGNYLIPKEAFQHKGMINISFLLEKKDKTQGLMTNALGYQVKNAPNVIIEVPADPSWEELVREWCAELINATIPIISVSKKDGVTTLNITDINGTKTVLIEDGYIPVKGVDYTDGISPIVSVNQITEGAGGYKISITDANGTKTIDILNGSDGSDANVTDENIKKALGFTPAKQEDVNKLSREIVNQILVLTEAELEALTQEELASKYTSGTKLIVTKEDAENLVPKSTDSNGNIYCGCGYKNNYRLKSDGSVTESRHLTVTGFMPCTYGSKISVVGWGANEFLTRGGQYVGVFDGNYNFIEVIDISAVLNLGVGTNGSYKNEANEITIDTSKRTSWKNMKYFRVSCVNTGDNVIATVDKY